MTFKYLLVAALIGFIFYLLLLRRLDGLRKAVISVVVLTMLVFAIQPDWSTSVAQLVGISRGVDLLFYLSHLTLFFFAFVYFLKFKNMEARFTKLVRQLALDRARTNP
jgi:small membrane protein